MDSESSQPCKRRCTERDKFPVGQDTGENVVHGFNTENVGRDASHFEELPVEDSAHQLSNVSSNDIIVDHATGQNSLMNDGEDVMVQGFHGDIQENDENSSSSSSSGAMCNSATDILVDWVKSQNISTISVPSCPSQNQDPDDENRPSCSYSSASTLGREPPQIVVEDTGEIIPVENLNSDSSDSESSEVPIEPSQSQSSEKSGSTFRIQPNRHTEMTLTFGGTGSRSNMTHTVLLGDSCNRRESVQYVFNFRSMSDSATQTDSLTGKSAVDTDKDNNIMANKDPKCVTMVIEDTFKSELYQNINNLPSNILIQIFKSLSMYDLLCQASLVCKMWHTLCRDPDLWRTVNLSHQHRADDDVLAQLTSFSDRVTSINLEDTKLLTTYGISLVCVKCKHLQKLKLTRCFSVENDVLMMVGNSCRNLQCLYLDGCYRISDQWTSNVGEGCPLLKELVLSRCSQMTDVGIGKIAQSCHDLQNIIIDHCNKVTDTSVKMLAEHCPDLLTLSLANCNITDTGICSVYRMKKLEYLDISNLPGGSITAAVVSQLTRQCDKLQCLNVSLNLTVDDRCMLEMMRYGLQLKKLFCVSCSISDEGLRGIAAHGRNIEKLDLGWCKDVTDKGIWDITENCPRLKYLGLIRCDSVTEKGVEDMVEKYPNIQFSTFFMESRKLIQKAIANGFKFIAESEQK